MTNGETQKMPRNILSPKNLDLLDFICEQKISTTKLIFKFFFKKKGTRENVSNILRRLTQQNFVSRDWLPIPASQKNRRAHPDAVYIVTKQNLTTLRKALESQRRADEWSRFEDHIYDAKRSARFAQNTLHHEIGITRSKLALESPIPRDRSTSIDFFLRTSPSHPDVSQSVSCSFKHKETGQTYKRKLPFNPDAFFSLQRNNKHSFYFLEFDNNTETTKEKLTNKFIAFYAYYKQNLFAKELLPKFNDLYGLNLTEMKKAPFRILFVTTNQNRANNLFMKSLALPSSALFNFTTIDQVESDPYGKIWMRKKEFAPYASEYTKLQKTARPSVVRAFRDESIEAMERIAIP